MIGDIFLFEKRTVRLGHRLFVIFEPVNSNIIFYFSPTI